MTDTLHLLLIRDNLMPTYTEGVLFEKSLTDNKHIYICDTLEDRVRDYNKDGDLEDEGEKKIYGQTAIPYNIYKCIVTFSPKFRKNMLLVENVKHFTGIRIHWGRTALNSEGCILVGKKIGNGVLANIGMTDKMVEMCKGKEVILEII